MSIVYRASNCEQLTIASRCTPTPKFVGHASTCVVSLQGVSWVTAVGHCGFKDSTRATSLTVCRSIGGWTTADGYREDTVTEVEKQEGIGKAEFGEQVFLLGIYLFTLVLARTADEMYGLYH